MSTNYGKPHRSTRQQARHYSHTMVECWDDEDYANLITESPSEEQAWDTLKSVASVYRERQADARYYKENC